MDLVISSHKFKLWTWIDYPYFLWDCLGHRPGTSPDPEYAHRYWADFGFDQRRSAKRSITNSDRRDIWVNFYVDSLFIWVSVCLVDAPVETNGIE